MFFFFFCAVTAFKNSPDSKKNFGLFIIIAANDFCDVKNEPIFL